MERARRGGDEGVNGRDREAGLPCPYFHFPSSHIPTFAAPAVMPVLLKPRVERAVAAGRAEASSAMALLSAENSELPAGDKEVWGSGCEDKERLTGCCMHK